MQDEMRILTSAFAISMGASIGALLRWWLGIVMNSTFPTIPLGTLFANIFGGLLMGMFMGIIKNHSFLSETARLAIVTGFLGGLTTFSTFSAEAVTLLAQQEYVWLATIIGAHVGGSILATIFGIYFINFLCFR